VYFTERAPSTKLISYSNASNGLLKLGNTAPTNALRSHKLLPKSNNFHAK